MILILKLDILMAQKFKFDGTNVFSDAHCYTDARILSSSKANISYLPSGLYRQE